MAAIRSEVLLVLNIRAAFTWCLNVQIVTDYKFHNAENYTIRPYCNRDKNNDTDIA